MLYVPYGGILKEAGQIPKYRIPVAISVLFSTSFGMLWFGSLSVTAVFMPRHRKARIAFQIGFTGDGGQGDGGFPTSMEIECDIES